MTKGTTTGLRSAAAAGLVLAYGVGAALQVAHGRHAGHDGEQLAPVAHWLRDSTLALPLAVVIALAGSTAAAGLLRWAGLPTTGRAAALLRSALRALGYAAAVVPAGAVHGVLFPSAGHGAPGPVATAALNASLALLTALVLLPALEAGTALARAGRLAGRRALARVALVGLSGTALLAGVVPAQAAPTVTSSPTAATQAAVAACTASTADRTYDVAAINVHVPYNAWGDANPNGMLFVLQGDKEAVRNWHRPLTAPGEKRRLRPRPLVLRANEGECVQVTLTNELGEDPGDGLPLDPRVSMSIRGVAYDVQTSSGSHAGYNEDRTVGRTQSTTQYWVAPEEGTYVFQDTGIPAGAEGDGGGSAYGLHGALVVEPPGSTWHDPRTGKQLYTETGGQSGELYLDAVIKPAGGRTFRETVQLAQDELPHTSEFAFNFGSEPQRNRDDARCPDCVGEETSLSSWTYGEPATVKLASGLGPWKPRTPEAQEDCGLGTAGFDADSCFTANVTHAYAKDPLKIRYGMAGGKETHVFHMHAHQWLAEPEDVGAAGRVPTEPSPTAARRVADHRLADLRPERDVHRRPAVRRGQQERHRRRLDLPLPPLPALRRGLLGPAARPRRARGRHRHHAGRPQGVRPAAAAGDQRAGRPARRAAHADRRQPRLPAVHPRPGRLARTAAAARHQGRRRARQALRRRQGARRGLPPRVQVETKVRQLLSGGRSKPGAPFSDPCPTGRARGDLQGLGDPDRRRLQRARRPRHPGPHARARQRRRPLSSPARKKPEPLFARVNAGDCITWELTNRLPNWFGGDAFQELTQTNMFGQHIHLVKFDVLASDGSSNGWNYQQAAFSREQADFNAATSAGTQSLHRAGLPAAAADPSYSPTTTSYGLAPGQTIVERWYADDELRTVFTHDHHFAAVDQNRGQFGAVVVEPKGMDFRDPRTGAFKQPVTAAGRGIPQCVSACQGNAVGTMMDVIGPGADDDYRDFGLAIADFVSLTRKGGDPRTIAGTINPPPHPEEFPDEDPGVMAINYRNAPLDLRRTKNGTAVDPAYSFSSTVFGDPQTPVLQTYAGDNVRIRLIQGSQEEQHQVLIHGQKWRKEPDDPQSPMVDAVPVGVSEAFNFEVPRLNCAVGEDCRGDYLYSGSSIDDVTTGAWGILRVNGGTVPGLKPLPDNVPTRAGAVPAMSSTALAPPAATTPGTPCATGAPVRKFAVVAMQAKTTYNEKGDHDPYGLVYALASDEAAIRGGKNPEPLVLRANEGDCIEVTLTNKLTTALLAHKGIADGDARVQAETGAGRSMGLRVSMHPGMLKYDVRGSDGAAVGFNKDSTVAPGKSRTYRWYADDVTPGEIGALNITDFGDARGHRHHGLFAGMVIEPKGATWHSPGTGAPLASGGSADVRVPGRADFREGVLFYQDGLNLRTSSGAVIADPVDHAPLPGEPAAGLDAEDQGEKAFSYRNEPFRHRLGYEPVANTAPAGRAMADVYDSHRHGDPFTPLLRAYSGDELRLRVLQGADKPRQHAFGLDGHGFKPQPDDPGGRAVGTLSGITVGSAVNAQMGVTGTAGDYLYGDQVGGFNRSAGLWGLLRVYPRPAAAGELLPTPVRAVDDPRAAGNHPLLPLELDTVQADVFKDLDLDGVRDVGEPSVAGATVAATLAGAVVTRGTSAADGQARLSVRAGTYGLTVTAPAGHAVSKAPATVTTGGNNALVKVSIALRAV